MTDVTPSDSPESPVVTAPRPAVPVVVAVTPVAGVDPASVVSAVRRQDRTPTSVVLIGEDPDDYDYDDDGEVESSPDLETLVASLGPEIDYVWILHADTEPRPDALRYLVEEAERHEAALVGSKLLVAGTKDTLESVGSATDVFGEPYTGLDENEVDLEQYDVVRDVAFVSSVSMLARRDVLRGLRGLDPIVPPNAAGLDLSQRVRIAGGRVMVTPDSEVFHHSRCVKGDGGWREQAGRLRAMLKAYTPVTLIWMVPFAFLVGMLDAIGNLFLGQWRHLPRFLLTWGWNTIHLPSTIGARRNIARVRQVSDEELYRYQVPGSVRLRTVGAELSNRLLGLFDEDRAITQRATELWTSAGTWGAVAAMVAVLIGVRSVFVGELPTVGFSLPFSDAGAALGRYFGGWNPAGLGSTGAIHPAAGLGGFAQALAFGNAVVARSVLTAAVFAVGVFGFARLAGRFRIGGPGAYLGGVVALFGPVAAVLATSGRWAGLLGVGLLPWALASVMGPRPGSRRRLIADIGRAAMWTGLVSFFVPLLGVVPLLFAIGIRVVGRFESRPLVALLALPAALVGVPYLIDHPERLLDDVPFGVDMGIVGLVALAAAALAAMVAGTWRAAAIGAGMAFAGSALARSLGSEGQVTVLAVAAVGSGLVAAAALRRRDDRSSLQWVSLAAGMALVVISGSGLSGGRAGLPPDQWGDELAFVGLDASGVERALLVAPEPSQLPGDSRPGPGFWYRLVDSDGATMDQAILPPPGKGDEALRRTLDTVVSGSTLRPGNALSEFAVRWVVAVDDSAVLLGDALDAQVDLRPLPLSENTLVYENLESRTVAENDDVVWSRSGAGFEGTAVDDRIRLAVQGDSRWGPDWQSQEWAGSVSGEQGRASFTGVVATRVMTGIGVGVVLLGLIGWLWGRRKPS